MPCYSSSSRVDWRYSLFFYTENMVIVNGPGQVPSSPQGQPKRFFRFRSRRIKGPRPGQPQGQGPRGPRPPQQPHHKAVPQGLRGPRPQQPAERTAPLTQGSGRKGNLKVYPLGGFEQVGRNCFVIEVDEDIYIIDLGLQFPDDINV